MIAGFATGAGTARYAARYPEYAGRGFYRSVLDWTVSTFGLGTYLGGLDDATDQGYSEAVATAVRGGINWLDTAINYRHQRSERSIGMALEGVLKSGELHRDEIIICTKAGFLTPGAVNPDTLRSEDIVGQMHALAPDFLSDQIDRSRQNLGLETIDVFYLHNPETQLGYVDRPEFEKRIGQAFERCEQAVAEGRIRWYGTATWNGYRVKSDAAEWLPFERLIRLAREAGGENHHLRFLQLPFNLAMTEAFGRRNQPWLGEEISILEAAARAGVHVVASAALLQARLVRDLPEELRERLAPLETDAQRAIQFTRSTPGIDVALVGMSQAAHVNENLMLSKVLPLTAETHRRLFQ